MTDPDSDRRGRFISFEGCEGAGKSIQSRRLADALEAHGIDVTVTREPGGSPGAEEIRALFVSGDPERWDAMTEALLLNAARRDHWQRVISPALSNGHWVICDRFVDSTLVYQGYCGGVAMTTLRWLHSFALGNVMPDLTLFLDLPPEIGLARNVVRDSGVASAERRFEDKAFKFHSRLQDGFKALAETEPERIVALDGARDIDTVTAAVFAVVHTRFAKDLSS